MAIDQSALDKAVQLVRGRRAAAQFVVVRDGRAFG